MFDVSRCPPCSQMFLLLLSMANMHDKQTTHQHTFISHSQSRVTHTNRRGGYRLIYVLMAIPGPITHAPVMCKICLNLH
jgi:hypothetical protein